jgi:large subunit ribosomal protein L4
MKLQLKNAGSASEIQLSDAAFGRVYNEALVHQVVTAYMAAGRAGTKRQKSRAEVRGGGKKPWAQKGTGQARAGSSRSPIWVGGGRTFAARPRDFSQKVNRKMYRAAMQSMVSELARQERIVAVESMELAAPKTKLLIARLAELGLTRALILVEAYEEKLFLAARNVPYVEVMPVASLDPLSLVKHDKVVATVGALKMLDQRLGGTHE